MMSAGGCDLERTLGALLPFDVAKIKSATLGFTNPGLRARQNLSSLEMICDLNERTGGDDLDVGARPGCLRAAGCGADQPFIARIRTDRSGQNPATAAIDPSRPSSPSTVNPDNASEGIAPIAAIRPSAIG